MTPSNPLIRRTARAVRKGSKWRRYGTLRVATVQFRRGGIVAYTFDRNSGGVMPVEDFRDLFEWESGR